MAVSTEDFIRGAKVKAVTAPGALQGIGVLIGYCSAPQVLIQTPDGNKFWWRADLCEPLDDETVRILRHVGVDLDGDALRDNAPDAAGEGEVSDD